MQSPFAVLPSGTGWKRCPTLLCSSRCAIRTAQPRCGCPAFSTHPRVARASQPWALFHNAVGVGLLATRKFRAGCSLNPAMGSPRNIRKNTEGGSFENRATHPMGERLWPLCSVSFRAFRGLPFPRSWGTSIMKVGIIYGSQERYSSQPLRRYIFEPAYSWSQMLKRSKPYQDGMPMRKEGGFGLPATMKLHGAGTTSNPAAR